MSVKKFAIFKRRLAVIATVLTIVNTSFSIANHAQAAVKVWREQKITQKTY
jgi:hypothetical protein